MRRVRDWVGVVGAACLLVGSVGLARAEPAPSGPDRVVEGAKKIGQGVAEAAKGIGTTVAKGAERVGKEAKPIADRLHDRAKAFGEAIWEALKSVGRTLQRVFTGPTQKRTASRPAPAP